jgi:RecA/RadA recombinase
MPNAFEIYQSRVHNILYFGSSVLDAATGGIECQGITEICGEAGSGKSQMCMMLSLQCQLPPEEGGLLGSTAYMSCGEGEFPIRRLQQLAERFAVRSRSGQSPTELLSRVHIEKCYCSENIQETILKRMPTMCRTENIRLLVIDRLSLSLQI